MCIRDRLHCSASGSDGLHQQQLSDAAYLSADLHSGGMDPQTRVDRGGNGGKRTHIPPEEALHGHDSVCHSGHDGSAVSAVYGTAEYFYIINNSATVHSACQNPEYVRNSGRRRHGLYASPGLKPGEVAECYNDRTAVLILQINHIHIFLQIRFIQL